MTNKMMIALVIVLVSLLAGSIVTGARLTTLGREVAALTKRVAALEERTIADDQAEKQD